MPDRRRDLDELSAILGASYEAFLRARLERRAGRRGKAHHRSFLVLAEMVNDMVLEAGTDAKAVWQMAVVELDRDRGEIEVGVLEGDGPVDLEHEWPAFLEWVGDFRS